MFSSPTEPQRAPGGWRTLHLVLAALIGFLVVLAVAATLLLQQAALQPSVRQLALPLLAVVDLADAGDVGDPARAARALERQGIERAAQPRPSVDELPVPFLEVLVAYLRSESGRAVEIEKGAGGSVRIWIASARGDWIGIPLEPMRTLVARFALLLEALEHEAEAPPPVAEHGDSRGTRISLAVAETRSVADYGDLFHDLIIQPQLHCPHSCQTFHHARSQTVDQN